MSARDIVLDRVFVRIQINPQGPPCAEVLEWNNVQQGVTCRAASMAILTG